MTTAIIRHPVYTREQGEQAVRGEVDNDKASPGTYRGKQVRGDRRRFRQMVVDRAEQHAIATVWW